MLITPAINMSGNCEEAIHFYEEVFSTKVDFYIIVMQNQKIGKNH